MGPAAAPTPAPRSSWARPGRCTPSPCQCASRRRSLYTSQHTLRQQGPKQAAASDDIPAVSICSRLRATLTTEVRMRFPVWLDQTDRHVLPSVAPAGGRAARPPPGCLTFVDVVPGHVPGDGVAVDLDVRPLHEQVVALALGAQVLRQHVHLLLDAHGPQLRLPVVVGGEHAAALGTHVVARGSARGEVPDTTPTKCTLLIAQ
jgi:hypothetical protein